MGGHLLPGLSVELSNSERTSDGDFNGLVLA
jgi:hypothetical protein